MIAFVIVCSLLLILWMERLSCREDLRHLHVTFRTDMDLVEPGEPLTLRYTVYNTSRFPLLYVGLALQLDDCVTVLEEESWVDRHLRRDFMGTRVDHRFYLLPRRRFSGKIRLAVKQRGLIGLGRCYLETGDLLGLRPVMRTREIGLQVICTAKRCDPGELRTLGGYLGDVSVRRFLYEDPTMLTGYREYTGREPMKQISWVQTAKTGQLTVRQYDHTVDRNVTVVVNMEAAHPPVMERCLILTRSVCEELEARKIPYAVATNGDLRSMEEGLGRSHLFFLLRRIGLSGPAGYRSFAALAEECVRRRRLGCSYIIITPALDPEGNAALSRLRAVSDMEPLILYGEESPV